MSHDFRTRVLLGALTAVMTTGSAAMADRIVDVNAKRPNDERQLRAFTLDNGLDVLLISDPKAQKSAASLDVAVGGLEDPWEHEGTAHFLEHMLFLGTDKYPDVDEYRSYLTNHQGSSNAYTAPDRTNYHFQVAHDALEGALDRFSQFFVAPRFDADFVDREMNAVNSEHQKNLQDDYWRSRMVFRHLHRDGHARKKFSTGDLETIGTISRDALIDFYEKYYSANVMKLVVISNAPVAELETMVRERFADVPNFDRAALEYPSDPFDPAALPMFVQIVPIAEQRSLRLTFTMPTSKPYYESKPTRLIGSLIGHEGKGSLLSQLKKENLATGLSAGDQQESYASYFNVRIELTEKGRNDVPRVVELFFAYVDMLRNEGLKEYYFKDRQTVTDLAYYFRDHEEGMDAASSYAASMQDHPALEFEKNERLISTYDPAAFAEFVSYLNPEGLVAILMAPDVVADQTEEHYGTSYGVSRFDEATIAQWKDPKGTDAFQYPEPNPFIASDLSILSNDEHKTPYKLIDDERGAFWFQQDDTFNLPKARLNLLLMTPETGRDPKHRLVAELYARSLNEGLNEWRYDVLEAGLWTDVSAEVRGIRINVNGYSERIPDLLRALSERMQDITIDEATYASIQDNLKREYANAAYDQAYLQTFYEFQFLLDPDAIHRKAYEAMVDDVTLDDVRAFAANVLDRVAIEGIAYGNLDPKTLKKAVKDVVETVSNETLPKAERTEPRELDLPDGAPYAHVFRSKSDNHCWMRFVQFGERDYRREAILRLGSAYLKTPFYTEMRTRQQLGYIVFSGASLQRDGQGMLFLIQSGDYPAGELASRASAYLTEALPAMADMTDEDFETMRASIVSTLEEQDKDMAERIERLELEAVRRGGDFGNREGVIRELKALTRDDVVGAFDTAFSGDAAASLSIFVDADGAETSKPADAMVIEDVDAFRSAAPVF